MRTLLALVLLSAPLYCQSGPSFQWIQQAGSGDDYLTGMASDAAGNVYLVGNTGAADFPLKHPLQPTLARQDSRDVFIMKLDAAGNVVYSTCFGGSQEDQATAMTTDPVGNVYVAGFTFSADFPVTKGAFRTSPPPPGPRAGRGWAFALKLNADGSLAYSTFLATSETTPRAIAVDSAGSAYLTGSTFGELPVTPEAYKSVCNCPIVPSFAFSILVTDGFLLRLDPTGSRLIAATYLDTPASLGVTNGVALAVAPDGSAYIGASTGIYRLDGRGTTLLGHGLPSVNVQSLALASDGSIYAGGPAQTGFQPTQGAAQLNPGYLPRLSSQFAFDSQIAIAKMDADLTRTVAATWFAGAYYMQLRSLRLDGAGNVYVGGIAVPHGLPTAAPIAQGFGNPTGFAASISGDLSSIQFSSYFGDSSYFALRSVAPGAAGTLLLAGASAKPNVSPEHGAVWVNEVNWKSTPSLRVDSVVNAASLLDDPLSPGETVAVRGSGFGAESKVLVNGVALASVSVAPDRIVAVLPSGLDGTAATVQVQSGGALSNSVLAPVSTAAPGLFSLNGLGIGQGYILNQDGSLNVPGRPAHPGEKITLYATGVGPVSFNQGYAETANPVAVFIDGYYALGVAAVMRPVAGFPGDVYQLTVYVPTAAQRAAVNPDVKPAPYAPQVSVALRIAGHASQDGLALSVAN